MGFRQKEKVGALRVFLDGRAGQEEHEKVTHRVGAGWVLQIANKIHQQIGLKWKAVVEVVRVLDEECTINNLG